MSNKATVIPVFRDHYRTLTSPGTRRITFADLLVQIIVPVGTAALTTASGARISDAAQLIAGGAVLAGFAFGLAVYVFQLRLECSRDPRVPKGGILLDLLDELFSNVGYTIAIGLTFVVLSVASTSYGEPDAEHIGAVWSFVLTAIGLHFITSMAICLKRLRAAYRQLTI